MLFQKVLMFFKNSFKSSPVKSNTITFQNDEYEVMNKVDEEPQQVDTVVEEKKKRGRKKKDETPQ
jgi:hypothetical protein